MCGLVGTHEQNIIRAQGRIHEAGRIVADRADREMDAFKELQLVQAKFQTFANEGVVRDVMGIRMKQGKRLALPPVGQAVAFAPWSTTDIFKVPGAQVPYSAQAPCDGNYWSREQRLVCSIEASVSCRTAPESQPAVSL